MSNRLLLSLLTALLCLSVACVVNPVTQRPDVVLVSDEQEVEAGNEAAEQIPSVMGIVEDRRLTGYVAEVGKRVAAYAPERPITYTFQIIDLPEPNAFALPGGHVYVSRGILMLANDEDELANVIAHEVIHVAARHHAQRQARVAGVGLLALPGLLAGALLPGTLGAVVSAPFAVAGIGAIANYSREQELEADRFGQQISAQAGYDPKALSVFLDDLERATRLATGEDQRSSWFDSHPSTPRRANDARRRAVDLTIAAADPVAPTREAYLQRIEGVMVGVNPAEGVFEGQRFLHPDMRFTLVFPDEWKTVNTRAAVGAVSPGRDAQLVLQLDSKGDDPREASSAFFTELRQQARVDVARLDALEIDGLKAVRGQAVVNRSATVDLTWIAYRGDIFLLAGVVPKGYSDAHRALFGRVGLSFRPITAAEREGIREQRLRLQTARAGESLASFGARVGNAWSPEETAVANGLAKDASLGDGQLLKVAIPQAYPGS
ncbi:MAG: M48 family metalloprotease [Myxococcota bacterium]